MNKTSHQKYTNQERISQIVCHNFSVASGVKKGEILFNHAFVDLERICNLSCHGCFEHLNTDSTRTKLKYEEVTHLIDFAREREAEVILIAGAGEPTLDSDFKRIIEYIYIKAWAQFYLQMEVRLTKISVIFYLTMM
jgi:MoaA/NifB/PqqE/SkfB family radical SAM enzyme